MSEASVIIDGVRSPLLEFGSPGLDEAVVFVHGNPRRWLPCERASLGSLSGEMHETARVHSHVSCLVGPWLYFFTGPGTDPRET